MRSYEALKYIHRTCEALRAAGVPDHRLNFLERWSSLGYQADRAATSAGGDPGRRTYDDMAGSYQKADVRVDLGPDPIPGWSDAGLRQNYDMFRAMVDQHLPELRRRALGGR